MSDFDDLGGNTIDIRDVFKVAEDLENAVTTEEDSDDDFGPSLTEQLKKVRDLLSELRGYGGDEKWRGDWYPCVLIRDNYFQDHAKELAEDIEGNKIRDAHWPFDCIDWDAAANLLKQDYSSVEFNDSTYWYRS